MASHHIYGEIYSPGSSSRLGGPIWPSSNYVTPPYFLPVSMFFFKCTLDRCTLSYLECLSSDKMCSLYLVGSLLTCLSMVTLSKKAAFLFPLPLKSLRVFKFPSEHSSQLTSYHKPLVCLICVSCTPAQSFWKAETLFTASNQHLEESWH